MIKRIIMEITEGVKEEPMLAIIDLDTKDTIMSKEKIY